MGLSVSGGLVTSDHLRETYLSSCWKVHPGGGGSGSWSGLHTRKMHFVKKLHTQSWLGSHRDF